MKYPPNMSKSSRSFGFARKSFIQCLCNGHVHRNNAACGAGTLQKCIDVSVGWVLLVLSMQCCSRQVVQFCGAIPPPPIWGTVYGIRIPYTVYAKFASFRVRDMDGLVVCAMAGARRGRGFEPRFVCPSRGPLVRPPPPPPSASRSTTGTAGATGGVSRPHSFSH